jgi:hypothetical protein
MRFYIYMQFCINEYTKPFIVMAVKTYLLFRTTFFSTSRKTSFFYIRGTVM